MLSKLYSLVFSILLVLFALSNEEVTGMELLEDREPVFVQTRAYLSRNRGKTPEFRFPLVSESALNRMMPWRSFNNAGAFK